MRDRDPVFPQESDPGKVKPGSATLLGSHSCFGFNGGNVNIRFG